MSIFIALVTWQIRQEIFMLVTWPHLNNNSVSVLTPTEVRANIVYSSPGSSVESNKFVARVTVRNTASCCSGSVRSEVTQIGVNRYCVEDVVATDRTKAGVYLQNHFVVRDFEVGKLVPYWIVTTHLYLLCGAVKLKLKTADFVIEISEGVTAELHAGHALSLVRFAVEVPRKCVRQWTLAAL